MSAALVMHLLGGLAEGHSPWSMEDEVFLEAFRLSYTDSFLAQAIQWEFPW